MSLPPPPPARPAQPAEPVPPSLPLFPPVPSPPPALTPHPPTRASDWNKEHVWAGKLVVVSRERTGDAAVKLVNAETGKVSHIAGRGGRLRERETGVLGGVGGGIGMQG